MIKLQRLFSVSILATLTSLIGNVAVAQVIGNTQDVGNLGAGPRVPSFCSLEKHKPCISVGFAQGFNFPEAGTSSNLSIAGDILLNKTLSLVSGGGASLDGNGANLYSGVVARSKIKQKGFGYAIGPVARLGFGADDITVTTFPDGSISRARNDTAFIGIGGTGQLIFKPSHSLVFWTGTDLSKNIFDGGGIVFNSFAGSAFKITNTKAGVLAGTFSISRTYGDLEQPGNVLGVGFVIFP